MIAFYITLIICIAVGFFLLGCYVAKLCITQKATCPVCGAECTFRGDAVKVKMPKPDVVLNGVDNEVPKGLAEYAKKNNFNSQWADNGR